MGSAKKPSSATSIRCGIIADSEPRREILYNSAKGGYLLDDTLSRSLTSSEILAVCKILLESRSMVKEEMFPILDKLIWLAHRWIG